MIRVFRNFSIYTGVSVITGSISFLLLPLLTTYLSPEDYGLLSIFNASIRFVSACIGLGMSHVLLVDLVKSRDVFANKLKGFGLATILISLLFSIIGLIYSLSTSSFFGIPSSFALLIPLISLLVVYFEFFTSIMIFLKQAKKFALFSLSKFGIETLLTFLFIVLFGMNWIGRIASLIISLILIVLLLLIYLNNEFDLSQKAIDFKKNTIELIREGGALIFMSVSFMVINLSDRFYIEIYEGIYETGIYSVAATIASIMFILISALMKVIRPMVYDLMKQGLANQLKKVSITYHAILLFLTALLMLVTPLIFKLFINQNFNEAKDLTYLLISGLFFWGGYSYYISFLLFDKRHNINSILAMASIILNLTLNYFLISKFGLIGAAFATLITYVCMFVSSFLISIYSNASNKQIAKGN